MDMQYTTLGRSGLKVSRLCLGTMNFGPETTKVDSFAIMDRALELGVNFFDTANVYGWEAGEGITEQIIGEWFAQGDHRRERTVLATKFYGGMGKESTKDWPNYNGGSALNIRRACDASLQRLKTDYIDVYQMHHIDRSVPWDEIWGAYETLKQQGKVLYFGSSNYAGWHIAQANEAAARKGVLGLVSEQSKYSLLQREIEMEVAPACEAYGVGIIPWSPLASGALAGIMKDQGGKRRYGEWTAKLKEEKGDALTQWEAMCEEMGESPADVAIAWTLTRPFVTAPIIGPRTMDQLNGSVRALEIELSKEQLDQIDELFPPFKTSPEHYAW